MALHVSAVWYQSMWKQHNGTLEHNMDMEQRMNSVLRQEQQMGGNFIDHKWWSGGGGVFDFHPQFHQCDESETKQNVLDGKKNICDGGTAMFVTEETMWEVGGSSFSVKPVLLMPVWIVTMHTVIISPLLMTVCSVNSSYMTVWCLDLLCTNNWHQLATQRSRVSVLAKDRVCCWIMSKLPEN